MWSWLLAGKRKKSKISFRDSSSAAEAAVVMLVVA
jgi:hypothetical protein